MKKIIIRFGLIGSAVIVVLFGLQWMIWGMEMDYQTAELLGYLTMILSLSFVFFGIKAFRDQENDGIISFGEALQLGSMIALVPSLAFCLYMILFFMWKGQEWSEYALRNLPEPQRIQFEQNAELYMNPFFQGVIMFITVFVIGFIIALISSFILKRGPKVETA